MNCYLKAIALSVPAAVLFLAGFEATASTGLNDPAPASRNGLAISGPQEESDDPRCDLARLMKLTGASGRPHAGSREENPRSAPAILEPPVFVKNPFLPTAPWPPPSQPAPEQRIIPAVFHMSLPRFAATRYGASHEISSCCCHGSHRGRGVFEPCRSACKTASNEPARLRAPSGGGEPVRNRNRVSLRCKKLGMKNSSSLPSA